MQQQSKSPKDTQSTARVLRDPVLIEQNRQRALARLAAKRRCVQALEAKAQCVQVVEPIQRKRHKNCSSQASTEQVPEWIQDMSGAKIKQALSSSQIAFQATSSTQELRQLYAELIREKKITATQSASNPVEWPAWLMDLSGQQARQLLLGAGVEVEGLEHASTHDIRVQVYEGWKRGRIMPPTCVEEPEWIQTMSGSDILALMQEQGVECDSKASTTALRQSLASAVADGRIDEACVQKPLDPSMAWMNELSGTEIKGILESHNVTVDPMLTTRSLRLLFSICLVNGTIDREVGNAWKDAIRETPEWVMSLSKTNIIVTTAASTCGPPVPGSCCPMPSYLGTQSRLLADKRPGSCSDDFTK